MPTMVFINLPVKDVDAATNFYLGLGYTKNEMFSDDSTSSIVISDTIVLMLLHDAKFQSFVTKPLGDSEQETFGTICLSVENRDDVDRLNDLAIASGGSANKEPIDMGFMYNRSFHDLDGHLIEIVWMDPTANPGE